MKKNSYLRSLIPLCLCLVVLMIAFDSRKPSYAQEQVSSKQEDTTPYLELSVQPDTVVAGSLVTLTIVYHHIGLPYTYIQFTPAGLVDFDPPITQPCKSGCTTFTLRAQASGTVEINATATGEIFDQSCQCWRWGAASDNGPAMLTISGAAWKTYLPSIQR